VNAKVCAASHRGLWLKNRLEEIRKQKSVDQEELAQQLGVSRQTISSIESGRYDPSLLLASKLARYFEMSIEDIFVLEEEVKRDHKRTKMIPVISLLVGIIIVVAGFVLEFNGVLGDRVSSVICYFGVSLFVFGCRDCWNAFMYRGTVNKFEIARHDERTVKIWSKASSISFVTALLALVFLAAVFKDLGYQLPSNLTYGLAVLSFGVLLISGWCLGKKL
jgi:putative transcriptional regulator